MTHLSPDAQAVVRICEQLTTQARRIADALSTPLATTDEGRSPLAEWRRAWAARPTGADVSDLVEIGPAAGKEQALRWARRESLLTLLSRAERGRPLTEDEARTLRQHIETETREADTARAIAAGNKRHVRVLYAELAQAQAAIERVRALGSRLEFEATAPGLPEAAREVLRDASRRINAALDGTEPAT